MLIASSFLLPDCNVIRISNRNKVQQARNDHELRSVIGRGEGARSQDYCEVNGEDCSLVFQLERPLELQLAKRGDTTLRTVPVPEEFLKWPGSPRDPRVGDPRITFRYDQDVEFIQDYVRSSEANRKGDEKRGNAYLERHVYGPKDHYAYLETVGIRKLLGLYTHPIVSW